MSGDKFLIDTNIILYILSGDKIISKYLYKQKLYASIISEMELLSFGNLTSGEEEQIKNFIGQLRIIPIDESIKELAILLRKKYSLKLPDAIIAGTANSLDLPLVTSDKQFRKVEELQIDFYEK
jgi:predicted nucleic acid-binding protein